MDYDFNIVYRPGAMHQDADALSRQDWVSDSDAGADSSDYHPRSGGVLLGGDVGTAPHIEEEAGSRKEARGSLISGRTGKDKDIVI